MQRKFWLFSVLVLVAALPVAAAGINSSIHVDSGEVISDDLSTLNGQIRIGDGATVDGEAEAVNGSIDVGQDVKIDGVSTVNGGIEIGSGTVVNGDVETVNGQISMDSGSRARSVSTVNGSLSLSGVEVDNDVSTYNGDVTLDQGTCVGGDLIIKEAQRSSNRDRRPLKIYLEDGSVVSGSVIVEDPDLEVEVYLRGGTVVGEIRGAKVIEK